MLALTKFRFTQISIVSFTKHLTGLFVSFECSIMILIIRRVHALELGEGNKKLRNAELSLTHCVLGGIDL